MTSRTIGGITLAVALALSAITPQALSHASDQTVISGDNYPKLPLSAYQYPVSRFGPGRPSLVKGLKIVSTDAVHKTVTLSWKSNPIEEVVDSYAIFYRTTDEVGHDPQVIGSLIAVTDKTSITSQLIGEKNKQIVFGYAPYGINEIPIQLLGSQGFPLYESVWVIAHNKNGWGDNDPLTPNPDENPGSFAVLSPNQQQHVLSPNVIPMDLKTLKSIDKRFSDKGWPNYKQVSDITDLRGTPPKTRWVVPWLPAQSYPLTRYQSGRPSDVTGLRASLKYGSQKLFQLTWDANASSENVDSYAIYGDSADGCPMDHCFYLPIAIVHVNYLKAKLVYTGFSAGEPGAWGEPIYQNGAIEFAGPHADANIYVIAHNARGWGNNIWDSWNPDQTGSDMKYLALGPIYQQPTDIIKVVAP